jgi:hypothetical protein
MSDIPEFVFDFDKIKGLSYEDGFMALFFQLQHHYNTYINKKPTFVFGADPADAPFKQEFPNTVAEAKAADPQQVPIVEPNQGGRRKPQEFKADTDTVTPKTIPMQGVTLTKSESGVILSGKADDGTEIEDILLPGYDKPPYGPVVSGRRGRYNLKKEVE